MACNYNWTGTGYGEVVVVTLENTFPFRYAYKLIRIPFRLPSPSLLYPRGYDDVLERRTAQHRRPAAVILLVVVLLLPRLPLTLLSTHLLGLLCCALLSGWMAMRGMTATHGSMTESVAGRGVKMWRTKVCTSWEENSKNSRCVQGSGVPTFIHPWRTVYRGWGAKEDSGDIDSVRLWTWTNISDLCFNLILWSCNESSPNYLKDDSEGDCHISYIGLPGWFSLEPADKMVSIVVLVPGRHIGIILLLNSRCGCDGRSQIPARGDDTFDWFGLRVYVIV